MALSENEQRLLEQMEAALAAEDPKLVNSFRGSSMRRAHRRRAALAGVAFFVGLAGLLIGLATQPWISVLGFVLMVVSAVAAIYSWQHVGAVGRDDEQGGGSTQPRSGYQTSFMEKMEDRWRRRRDEEV